MSAPVDYLSSEYRSGLVPRPVLKRVGSPGTRLNVLTPHLSRAHAFGGLTSALELAREIATGYDRVRFLSQTPLDQGGAAFDVSEFAPHVTADKLEKGFLYDPAGVEVHDRDIFFCTFWSTVLAWEAHAALLEQEGKAPNPFYYFIQDYEPGFYPMGHKHAMALATYRHKDHCHAVFNSRELAGFFQDQGLDFSARTVLSPSLNPSLHAYLEANRFLLPPKPADNTAILVYGRPNTPRNCFAPLLEGLHLFAASLPQEERKGLMLLSAGHEHPDMVLADQVVLKSVGKLPLERYAAFLAFSHMGVSFMATPHPSYPPLEMASFGLYTITNSYPGKDLSQEHELIHSLAAPDPVLLAEELRQGLDWTSRQKGKKVRCGLPRNMSPLSWQENIRAARIPRLVPSSAE